MAAKLDSIFGITLTLNGVEASTPRKRATALRKSFRHIGERHHKVYKMLKFTKSAYRRYGLRPRSTRYEMSKKARARDSLTGKRATGELLPFVFTGTSRRTTKAGNRVTVSRVSEQGTCAATVHLHARVINYIPWLLEEFQRVNNQELRAQGRAGIKVFERELTRTRARKKRPLKR